MQELTKQYPLIKLIEIDNLAYLYDARSSFIAEIEKKYIFEGRNKTTIKPNLIDKFEKLEFLKKGGFDKVVPDDNELKGIVEYQLNSYIPRKFTIEVTENCNLKCKYCFFSKEEKSTVRKHSCRNMEIETAKKAIDFYYNFYTSQLMKVPENKRKKLISLCPPIMSWWGGEPFLAFDIIKESKKYFDSLNWKKFNINIKQNKFTYFLASNLTIMNEEIAEFLVNNNIILHVSLDGDKEENDKNRVFDKGKGTFEIIIKNLEYLINKYPKYAKTSIIIQSVAADNIDVEKSYNFITKFFKYNTPESKISKSMFAPQKKEKVLFSDSYVIDERDELEKFKIKLSSLVEETEEKLTQRLMYDNKLFKDLSELFLLERELEFENPQNIFFKSNLFSCPIEADGVFVAVNGDFHMCMKYDYSFPFGNVHTEVDKNAIVNIYKNHISGFREKCKNCWAINFCPVCPAQILYEKQFYFPTNKDCDIIKLKSSIALKKYILFTNNKILYNNVKNIFKKSKFDNYILDTGPININNLKF